MRESELNEEVLTATKSDADETLVAETKVVTAGDAICELLVIEIVLVVELVV